MLESPMERSSPAAVAPSPFRGGAPHPGTIPCPFLGCKTCAVTRRGGFPGSPLQNTPLAMSAGFTVTSPHIAWPRGSARLLGPSLEQGKRCLAALWGCRIPPQPGRACRLPTGEVYP